MNVSRTLNAIDSHTAGEPTRIIVGGVPNIPGKNLPAKKAYMETEMDWLRQSVMLEPRGHANMFGSILTAPSTDEADFGIIFMDGGGYLNMCGHGTIGAATVAVETGMVPLKEPITPVTLEAPAGLVRASVNVEEGKAKSVSFINVPSFLYKENVELETPLLGKVKFDIAFGGSFFAIIEDKYFGLEILPENASRLTQMAMELRKIINETIEIVHPTLDHIKTVDLIEIYGKATNPKADFKNVVIFGAGQVDRSPCGTGTSAKIATLVAKGKLAMGEEFVYESILGTLFKGKAVKATKVGDFDAILPEITGSAWITGFNTLIIDDTDPVHHGFSLS